MTKVEGAFQHLDVPVGFFSTAKAIALRDGKHLGAPLAAPGTAAFRVAEDKQLTYRRSENLGIRVPGEFGEALRSGDFDRPALPVIAKLRHERGGSTAEVIRDVPALRDHVSTHTDQEYLYQEMVQGGGTLAHCGFFIDGQPVAEFQHHEVRSVPRVGGSGTRLKSIRDTDLRDQSRKLLADLSWTGLAQVEFKRSDSGELTLMEINPKIWASYALASRAGPPLVAIAARHAMERPLNELAETPLKRMSMAFPLREALHIRRTKRYREIPAGFVSMLRPPVRWDVELRDLRGYLQSI